MNRTSPREYSEASAVTSAASPLEDSSSIATTNRSIYVPSRAYETLDDTLAPPSLIAHNNSNTRYMTSASSSSVSMHHSAFDSEEPRVYRSVAMEAPTQLLGTSGFERLGEFDSSLYHHDDARQLHSSMKELNITKPISYAAYTPTLVFESVKQDQLQMNQQYHVQTKSAPPTVDIVPQQQQGQTCISTLNVKVPQTSQPPIAPMWLEPNSHFYCTAASPSQLFETLLVALQSLHEAANDDTRSSSICTLDCVPSPQLFKLSCTAYQRHSGVATPFIVRVFTTDASKSKYVVEFQRRQGDVVHFYEIFRTARTRITSAYPMSVEEGAELSRSSSDIPPGVKSLDPSLVIPQLELRSWSAPSLPSSAGVGSFNKDHICETVRSLLQMCASPCIDIKTQGVLALAELSCSPSFDEAIKHCSFNIHEVLIAEGCVQLFLECLPLKCQDIHRASLTALANLAETQSNLCTQLVSDAKSLSYVYALTSSGTHQVVRESARVLAALASRLGPELLRALPNDHHHQFHATLKNLAQHQDVHVVNHASKIHQAIGATNTPIAIA
jgi:hypothetical protein